MTTKMPYNPLVYHHRSIRLKNYDYTLPGAYFVTMNVWHRERLFGTIQHGEMRLTPAAQIVAACWQRLPAAFAIRLDAWVIMPDHFHGIIVIEPDRKGEAADRWACVEEKRIWSAASPQPPQPPQPTQRPIGTQPGSLGAILQNFKSVSTRQINQARRTPGAPV
jgi:putative transposase